MTVSVWLAFICETHVFWCVFAAPVHMEWISKITRSGRTTRPGRVLLVWITVNKREADRMDQVCVFLNSVLLGVGLAMDAFSVSMANGLHDPKMNKGTMCKIAGTFALFPGRNAHDRLGVRAYHRGAVCVETDPWIAGTAGLYRRQDAAGRHRGEEAEEATQLSAGTVHTRPLPPASMPFRWASPSRNTAG